jgi:hypothetical protein
MNFISNLNDSIASTAKCFAAQNLAEDLGQGNFKKKVPLH